MRQSLCQARRVAGLAALFTMPMAAGKALVKHLTGSAALLADALHSSTVMLALAASWFGLYLASRPPCERFPYGFYRARTLGALVASGVILNPGGELLWSGVGRLSHAGGGHLPGLAWRWRRRRPRRPTPGAN